MLFMFCLFGAWPNSCFEAGFLCHPFCQSQTTAFKAIGAFHLVEPITFLALPCSWIRKCCALESENCLGTNQAQLMQGLFVPWWEHEHSSNVLNGGGTGELWKELYSSVEELVFSLNFAARFPGQSWPSPFPFYGHGLFYKELVWLISESHSFSERLWFIQKCHIPQQWRLVCPTLGRGWWYTSHKCFHSLGNWAKWQLYER